MMKKLLEKNLYKIFLRKKIYKILFYKILFSLVFFLRKKKQSCFFRLFFEPGGIRTPDHMVRSHVL